MPPERDESSAIAVKQWIEGEGYRLEHSTAVALREAGLIARQGVTYAVQDETRKIRDIDVLGTLTGQHKVEMHLVVECKRSKRGWFTRTTSGPTYKGRVNWLPIASASVRSFLREHRGHLEALSFGPDNHAGIPFDVIESHARNEDRNAGYAALRQVTDGADGLLHDVERFPNAALFHPVVVLEAPLYRADFTGVGTEVRPVEIERLHWSGASSDGPVVVDVVTLGGLTRYLHHIVDRFEDLAGQLDRAPNEFGGGPEFLQVW